MKKLLLAFFLLISFHSSFSQDLIIESITTSPSFYRYDQFKAEVTIKNIGILPTERSYGSIYLTTDIDENQKYVAEISIPALASNESYTYTEEGYSINITEGTYTLVAIITNYYDWEVNIDNNRYIGSEVSVMASTADLVISSATSLSTNISKGGVLDISMGFSNLGTPIYSTYVTAYLSEDEILDDEDIELHEHEDYVFFSYQDTYSGTMSFAIPYNQVLGEYNVILVIDARERIDEVDEENNQFTISNISIIDSDIDLNVIYGFSIRSDYDIFVDWTVENSGTTNSGIQKFQIYGSYNGYSPDVPLGEIVESYKTIEAGEEDFFYHSIFIYEELNYDAIIIENTDPDYPLIDPYVILLDPYFPPNNNFEISSFEFNPQPETSDDAFSLTIELSNPNDNSISEYAEFNINLTSLDGSISESFIIEEFISLWNYSTELVYLSLDNRASLKAGEYNVTVSASIPYLGVSVEPSTGTTEIIQSDNDISVNINGNEGEVINNGVVYLYEKIGEDIVYQGNQEISLKDGVGNVTFQKVKGNYMFYAVPDIVDYPNYVPTVSGNTFTLEASSFQLIEADVNLDIDLIYVDPTPLNGNKLIEGNIINGSTSNDMSLTNVANTGFNETNVYLISENFIIAKTITDTNGAFSFHNVPEGNFDVYFDDGNIVEENDVNVPVNLTAEDDILQLDINNNGEVQATNLDMDFSLISLSTEELGINSESLNLELQIQGNPNNDIDALPVNFLIQVERDGSEIESFSILQEINLSQSAQNTLTFNPTFDQSLSPGSYQFTITYISEFKDENIGISTSTTILNNAFTFQQLSITNELNTNSEEVDITLEFSGNNDNDIVDLNTTFNISILSGTEVIFEQELIGNLNITTGSVATEDLSATLINALEAGEYILNVSYSNEFMETPYTVDGLAFEVMPVINNSITFQELTIVNELNTDSEEVEISLAFSGNDDNDIVDLATTFNISILSGTEVIFDQELIENLNINKGSVSTVELSAYLINALEAGEYILNVSYSNEFMETPYTVDGLLFEVMPVINNTFTFQELSITNELNTDSEELKISLAFSGNNDNDIIDLATTFNISILSGTEIIFEQELIENLNITTEVIATMDLSATLINPLEAGDYILSISYSNEFMEVPYYIEEIVFEVKNIITSNKLNEFKEIVVFPNPTNGFISIRGDFSSVELFDLKGKKVLTSDLKTNSRQMNLGGLNLGIYLLKVNTVSGYKFIKVVKK